MRAVDDVDVYIEQPCLSYEECLSIRRRTSHPFVIDEVVDGLDMLMRGHADGAMDVVNIKISKFGGLTKASLARDLCVSMGVAMTIEDSWGGDITTAAIAHLAHSTPTEFLFTATDFNSYVTVSTAEGAPQRVQGRMAASTLARFWASHHDGMSWEAPLLMSIEPAGFAKACQQQVKSTLRIRRFYCATCEPSNGSSQTRRPYLRR